MRPPSPLHDILRYICMSVCLFCTSPQKNLIERSELTDNAEEYQRSMSKGYTCNNKVPIHALF